MEKELRELIDKGYKPKKILSVIINERKIRDNRLREHPLPDYAVPSTAVSESNANNLTKAICNFINAMGGHANRINTVGIYDAKRKAYRKGTTIKGTSDIIALYKGKSLHIEVKYGNDRLIKEQIAYLDLINSCGGYTHVARNIDSFFEWFVKEVL